MPHSLIARAGTSTGLSHAGGTLTWTSEDGPPGVYVVPQKRGRTWSPVASPHVSDRPAGLGFLPFRKTPTLLTPEAWRPGCLYVADPPAEEARQADAWWDGLSAGAGHVLEGDAAAFSREGGQGSWRDRYANNPASRRFHTVHRRAVTEG